MKGTRVGVLFMEEFALVTYILRPIFVLATFHIKILTYFV